MFNLVNASLGKRFDLKLKSFLENKEMISVFKVMTDFKNSKVK